MDRLNVIGHYTNAFTECYRIAGGSPNQRLGGSSVLQWVPSRVGLVGNDNADKLAKQDTTLQQPVTK